MQTNQRHSVPNADTARSAQSDQLRADEEELVDFGAIVQRERACINHLEPLL